MIQVAHISKILDKKKPKTKKKTFKPLSPVRWSFCLRITFGVWATPHFLHLFDKLSKSLHFITQSEWSPEAYTGGEGTRLSAAVAAALYVSCYSELPLQSQPQLRLLQPTHWHSLWTISPLMTMFLVGISESFIIYIFGLAKIQTKCLVRPLGWLREKFGFGLSVRKPVGFLFTLQTFSETLGWHDFGVLKSNKIRWYGNCGNILQIVLIVQIICSSMNIWSSVNHHKLCWFCWYYASGDCCCIMWPCSVRHCMYH